uniref:Cytosolic carboxypeptidase 6 n=1 Tax=Petromyzon marinus TaxID=7757 RepID=A0AAJ7TQF2_PETMA|nr:cytosolic carboxypeptidase 6 [Petromyzon marinus]
MFDLVPLAPPPPTPTPRDTVAGAAYPQWKLRDGKKKMNPNCVAMIRRQREEEEERRGHGTMAETTARPGFPSGEWRGVGVGSVGNVSRLQVAPPDHVGPTKRGHLVFNAAFESGNLGRVDCISEAEYDLFMRPDTCNPRYRVWFNFTVGNVRANQRAIFNLVNFSKTRSLYRDGMTPVVKSTSRPQWTRLPGKHVFYYRSPEHRGRYVVSFAFCFDREEDEYQFAYCFPYTYSQLQRYLDALQARGFDYVHRELLGLSVQQRRLDLLTITSPGNLGPGAKRRVVLVMARVHPGETPSSYVCQGLIDFLVSQQPAAVMLRERLVFKIVPMLNPDGVHLGNYRCSLMGFDLNRSWQDPSPWAHPTLHAVRRHVVTLQAQPNTSVDVCVDVHAHSTLANSFVYGNAFDEAERSSRQLLFPRLLCRNASDFSLASTTFDSDAAKAGTARRSLSTLLSSSCLCYTLEVSFSAFVPPHGGAAVPYTCGSYMNLGKNLARTFLDFYRLQGIIQSIPLSVASERHDRATKPRSGPGRSPKRAPTAPARSSTRDLHG